MTNNIRKLDLRGTSCPLNFVKTKLELEKMSSGDLLEVILNLGEPEKNVPMSLEADGYTVLSITRKANYCTVKVENK